MIAVVAVIAFLLATGGLLLAQRRRRRAASRLLRARQFWAERHGRVYAEMAAQLPSEEFAREHLNWWAEDEAER